MVNIIYKSSIIPKGTAECFEGMLTLATYKISLVVSFPHARKQKPQGFAKSLFPELGSGKAQI